ncbi:hypothetical protein [Sphingomonas sp. NPDC079357]|uniref:hypothetical protein n=1 Tax=Sphingomonas sp. NPDC079357 TaxID=3364518 RepID=UPI00384B9154
MIGCDEGGMVAHHHVIPEHDWRGQVEKAAAIDENAIADPQSIAIHPPTALDCRPFSKAKG